jgi:uncharacterized protein YecE (DUF72 family)
MKLWIGTSGFQYAEWKGTFYPEDLPASKMLPFYAERFSTTEVNYTFHRIPSAKTIDNWKQLTPESFRFALKAPQKIRHFEKLRDCADTLGYFCQVISGSGERLGPVLFQLPPNFKKDTAVLSSFLRELPSIRAASTGRLQKDRHRALGEICSGARSQLARKFRVFQTRRSRDSSQTRKRNDENSRRLGMTLSRSVFVTGATGYLGSHLLWALLHRGNHKVINPGFEFGINVAKSC